MNKKLLLFLFVFLLLVIPFKWSSFREPFKETQDHIPFTLINLLYNAYIKKTHTLFNIPLNQEICKENLLLFNEIMNLHKIPFWLSEGTALGVVRNNSFISHDDDVDVSFMYNYREIFLKDVLPVLFLNNFVLGGSANHGNYIGLHRNGEKFDIDIVQQDGQCVANRTSNTKFNTECNNLLKYLNNMRQIEFLGTTFKVPGDDYLEYLYSSSWKIPKKSKFKNNV